MNKRQIQESNTRIISFMIYLLFLLTIFFPTGTLISASLGYSFELASASTCAYSITILSICTLIFSFPIKNKFENTVTSILVSLITPLSLINFVFFTFACNDISIVMAFLITTGCCIFLSLKHGKPKTLKITSLILSALMIIPIAFFSFVFLIFGNIGQTTVVQTIESPNQRHYAQVIDSDSGALGGDTLVDVYEKGGINTVLFKIAKKPERVYWGEWGAYENMNIYWKNNECLVINDVEYYIR